MSIGAKESYVTNSGKEDGMPYHGLIDRRRSPTKRKPRRTEHVMLDTTATTPETKSGPFHAATVIDAPDIRCVRYGIGR